MTASKPGSPEAMELARATLAAIKAAGVERKRADGLWAALRARDADERHRLIDQFDKAAGVSQALSLILAVLAGACATLAAVLPMVRP